jgi:hypothetical protein
MTDATPAAPVPAAPLAVRAEHSGAFMRLSQLWLRRSHFSLVLATVDDHAYRDALIDRLDAILPAAHIELSATDAPTDWLLRLQPAQAERAGRVHVCMPLHARWPDAWWQQANLLRERLADAYPALQLVWLSDGDVNAAAHQAPDLWNWREAVFGFASEAMPSALLTAPGAHFDPAAGVNASEVTARLAQIERYLATQDTDALASAHLRLEAARAYQRLGRCGEGESAARQAVVQFEAAGDEVGAAHARRERATILWLQGAGAAAITLLRQEVLPVYERVGLAREADITRARMAELQRAAGWPEEA